jgi:hypothetical protein
LALRALSIVGFNFVLTPVIRSMMGDGDSELAVIIRDDSPGPDKWNVLELAIST